MLRCEFCGNESEMTFEVVKQAKSHVFDSFECAIHLVAPECPNCGCKIIGHGVETGGSVYCSPHCACEVGGFAPD